MFIHYNTMMSTGTYFTCSIPAKYYINYALPSQPLYVFHTKRGVLFPARKSFSHCLTKTVTNKPPPLHWEKRRSFFYKKKNLWYSMVVEWNEMSEIVNSRVYHNETSVTSHTICFIKISIYTDGIHPHQEEFIGAHCLRFHSSCILKNFTWERTVAWPGYWVALGL